MSNRKELRDARRKVEDAASSLKGIESLPRRIGQTIDWPNGVRWVRIGDDAWEARHASENYERHPQYDEYFGTYPSSHVAWGLGYGR